MKKEIKETVEKYLELNPGKNNSEIADLIIADGVINRTHRTIRLYVGEVRKSQTDDVDTVESKPAKPAKVVKEDNPKINKTEEDELLDLVPETKKCESATCGCKSEVTEEVEFEGVMYDAEEPIPLTVEERLETLGMDKDDIDIVKMLGTIVGDNVKEELDLDERLSDIELRLDMIITKLDKIFK